MASFFIPSSIQKRLLRYALSRVDVLDTDGLDLEQLDITWGKRSTVELKDVGLNKLKFGALLGLPEQFKIQVACVTSVKILVPADIHTSSIVVTIQGVRVDAHIYKPILPKKTGASSSSKKHTSTTSQSSWHTFGNEKHESGLPTTHDLAKSFLAEEPLAEKRELEAVLASQPADVRQSVASLASTESDLEEGVGTGVGLPSFLAAFLQGIGDRLQVNVQDVVVRLDISDLHQGQKLGDESTLAVSALGFEIANIEIHDAGLDSARHSNQQQQVEGGRRQIVLKQLRTFLFREDPGLSLIGQPGTEISSALHLGKSVSIDTISDSSDHGTSTMNEDDKDAASTYSLHDALRTCRQDKDARSKQNMASSGMTTPRSARSRTDLQSRSGEASPASMRADSPDVAATAVSNLGFYKIPSPTTGRFEVKSSEGDLGRSMLFTTDEAESLYISAIDASPSSRLFRAPMPGGWGVESEEDIVSGKPRSSLSGDSQTAKPESVQLQTGSSSRPVTAKVAGFVRTFMDVARVDLWLPSNNASPSASSSQTGSLIRAAMDSTTENMTGSFSSYADMRHKASRQAQSRPSPIKHSPVKQISPPSVTEITTSSVSLQADIATLKALIPILMSLQAMTTTDASAEHVGNEHITRYPSLKLMLKSLTINLVKELNEELFGHSPKNDQHQPLLAIDFLGVSLASRDSKLHLEIDKSSLSINGEERLVFDNQARTRTSVRDLSEQSNKDISVELDDVKGGTEVHINTQPLKLDLDLSTLEHDFETFGGLSAFLDMVTSTPPGSETIVAPRPRTVRFDVHTPMKQETSSAGIKMYARIDGVSLVARSFNHTLKCDTSALKITSRANLNVLQIDQITFQGPTDHQSRESTVGVQIRNLRLAHLEGPEETDLTRLIELLTPSKDRFEGDDDLLVDTLIRQRRKGPVLRVTASSVGLDVGSMKSALSACHEFVEDLGRFSAIAKYLPEDDRPQLMTLTKIDAINMNVETDHAVGALTLTLKHSDFAHVGLPLLLACSIGKVGLYTDDRTSIVGPLLEYDIDVQTPVLMAKIIGDDLRPTIKLKMWNVVFEYSVPLVLSAMGLSEVESTDTLVADLAASIASLTQSQATKPDSTSRVKQSSETSSQPMNLHLMLRDCAIGLTPRSLPSKALFLLSNAKVIGTSPMDGAASCQLDIRKGGMLIIDDIQKLEPANASTTAQPSNVGFDALLCRKGYVSISTISAAVLDVKLHQGENHSVSTFDVAFADELFVLETCADSTQTLIETLNELVPPLPPPQGNHYRTEVAPMEDMMASFSGDAFTVAPPQDNVETGKAFDDDIDLEHDFEDLGFVEEGNIAGAAYPSVANGSSNRHGRFGSAPHRLREKQDYTQPVIARSRRVAFAKKWDSINNYYAPVESTELASAPLRVKVRDVHFIWNMFDGYDWQKTRDTITKAVYDVEHRAKERRRRSSHDDEQDEEPVIGDFLFNSIYIGIPINADPQDLTHQINKHMDDLVSETASLASTATSRPSSANRSQRPRRKLKLERSKRHKLAIELRGVSADVFVFPPGAETQTSIDVRVTDLEIFDHVPTSTWKKFATYMHDAGPRVEGVPMIHLEICNVRPIPELLASELVIKVSLVIRGHLLSVFANACRLLYYLCDSILTRMRWTS